MPQPDPTKDEPNFGVSTLVLYATSSPVDFGPLQQTRIKTDSALIGRPRGSDFVPVCLFKKKAIIVIL